MTASCVPFSKQTPTQNLCWTNIFLCFEVCGFGLVVWTKTKGPKGLGFKNAWCWNAKSKESKKVVRVLWGLYLLYPFVPGIMISHYRIPIDQPVQCDVQFFFVALSSSDHGDDPMIAVFEESATWIMVRIIFQHIVPNSWMGEKLLMCVFFLIKSSFSGF